MNCLDEITKLRCIVAKNCYPNWLFNNCLRKFENNTKLDSQDKEVDDCTHTYLACHILENHRVNLNPNCLPYQSKEFMFEFLLITPP